MPTAAQSPPPGIRRIVSAALVLLLHLLLVMALLHSVIRPDRPAAMREIFFHFAPPAQRAAPLPPPLPAMVTPPRGGVVSGAAPLPIPAAPDMRGVGQSLFGCAPENLGSLTPEQRSHCDTAFARPGAGTEPPSHVKDAARWADELKARNTPGRIPCTYIAVTPAMAGGGDNKVPMAEFVCLHKLLSQ